MGSLLYKTPFHKTIEGIVTEVNASLLFFEVDNELRIYVDITNHSPTFPSNRDSVEISNIINFTDSTTYTGVMGPETLYNFSTKNTHDTELFWTLKTNNICDPEELLIMDRIIRRLTVLIPLNIVHKCLTTLLFALPFLENKKSFKKTKVKFPEDLNYVNKNSEFYTFMKYDGMCNWNVYPSQSLETPSSNAEFLFGILDVDHIFGHFSLMDKGSKIFVKCIPNDDDLYKFKNTLVMIKKWTVFTEVFELAKAPTLKYLLINFEDVAIIKTLTKQTEERVFYGKNEVCKTEVKGSILFQIHRISDVIFGYRGGPECWIEGYISEKGSIQRTGVHIIQANLSVKPFLKEKTVYKLMFNIQPIREKYNPQLYSLKDGKEIYRIDKNTIFQETDEHPYLENELLLNSFQQVKDFILEGLSQFFSFTLKISRKQLQKNPFKPWYPKRYQQTVPYCGNPDNFHQTRLLFYDNDRNTYLDLYLTNRDNHVTPLGLIEDMVIKVKHVQQNKNKYLKTTVMSSFEVLEYSPKIRFSSVTLSLGILSTWNCTAITSMTPLGIYYSLPFNCIVKGSFVLQAIFDLIITPVCQGCQKWVVAEQPCSTCKITKRDLNVQMTIYAQDARMPSFNIEVDQDFFFKIIGLKNPEEIQYISDAFYKCDGVRVDFCNFENFNAACFTRDSESKEMLEELAHTIYSYINFKVYSLVDAVCVRKMGHTPWHMLQFQIIYNSDFGET